MAGSIRKTIQVLIVFILVAATGRATLAKAQNIVEVEGPRDGETTYMMQSPRSLGDDVLIRPLAVTGPDGNRFAFMLNGVDEGEAVGGEQYTLSSEIKPALKDIHARL